MNKDINKLYGYSLKSILDKSKNMCFLTQEEFMKDYGIVNVITSHVDKVEDKFKILEAKLKLLEAKVIQLETKLLKK
jgi:hypothetical protein